ncbi:MAG: hypothetical protein ACJAS4_001804 [Bacteriovoracaceae bacterium]|jgi:hypothetical protein
MKVTILVLFSLIQLFSTFSYAENIKTKKISLYKYNQKKSVSFNEKGFLRNLSYDCEKNGYDRGVNATSPKENLATFPKELAFLYLKKNIKSFCYYSFSTLIKYLSRDFKTQTENIVVSVVEGCVKDNDSFKLCPEIQKISSLFDLTILLGNYCSWKTLKAFKKVNCHFKKVAKRNCSLYSGLNRTNENCPNFYTNKREIKELHKSYFGSHCKKLKWREPSCID